MSSEHFTACHWVRLSETLLCSADDCWNARQLLLNRAYIRDRGEVRRATKKTDTERCEEEKTDEHEVTAEGNEFKAEVDEVTAEENEVKAQVNQVKAEENEVKAEVNEVAAEVNQVKAEENEVKAEVYEVTAEVNQVKAEENEVKAEVNQVKAEENEIELLQIKKPDVEEGLSETKESTTIKAKEQDYQLITGEVVNAPTEVQDLEAHLQLLHCHPKASRLQQSIETGSEGMERKVADNEVKVKQPASNADQKRVKKLENEVKETDNEVKVSEHQIATTCNDAGEERAIFLGAGDLSLSSEEEEAALMRALGLPTSFGRPRDSSGELSDDEAPAGRAGRRRTKVRRQWQRPAALQEGQRLAAGDKDLKRRFERFWREEGASLKYSAFAHAFGPVLGADFWRTVPPAAAAKDPFLSQAMAAAEAEEEREEEQEEEEGEEFDWEAAWPDFVVKLRQRWFLWFLHEHRAGAPDPDQAWLEQLRALGCACELDQIGAFRPIALHAKTNRVAASHSRLAPVQCCKDDLGDDLEDDLGNDLDEEVGDDVEDELRKDEPNDLEMEVGDDLGVQCDIPSVSDKDSDFAIDTRIQPNNLDVGTNDLEVQTRGLEAKKEEGLEKDDPELQKYWNQRYRLFSLFDDGVRLDRESWFSVTPEKIARHQAERLCNAEVIVDAFCGAGGNTIQFAQFCDNVIAIDLDPEKLALARNNADVYGVTSRVHFLCGDFFRVLPSLRLDPARTAIFLSPPWGGPAYLRTTCFDLSDMGGLAGPAILAAARRLTPNVALFAPRNANVAQVVGMAAAGEMVEIEQNFLNNKLKAVTAYFGGLVDNVTASY